MSHSSNSTVATATPASSSANHTSSNDTDTNYYYYYTLDMFLNNYFGSTIALDVLFLYVMTADACLGFALNLLSFATFTRTEFTASLYHYLRVYTLNSALINFLYIFELFACSPRLMPKLTLTFWPQFYYAFILMPVANICYFFGTALDILITMDRIGFFNQTIKAWLTKATPYKIAAVAFFICFCLDFPYYLVYQPTFMNVSVPVTINNESFLFKQEGIWYTNLTWFATTQAGKYLVFTIYGVRDLLLLLTEITLSFVAVFLLRKHLAQRTRFLIDHPPLDQQQNNQNGLNRRSKQSSGAAVAASRSTPTSATRTAILRVTQSDRRMCVMTLLLCALSICEHVSYILCTVFPYFFSDSILYNTLSFAGDFSVTFKHSVNFFIFYFFNRQFKIRIDRILKNFQGLFKNTTSSMNS